MRTVNRTSKRQAVSLIRSALAQGWDRKVTAEISSVGRWIIVELSKQAGPRFLRTLGVIWITFRIPTSSDYGVRRSTVKIRSQCIRASSSHQPRVSVGRWDACYLLKKIADEAKWEAEVAARDASQLAGANI